MSTLPRFSWSAIAASAALILLAGCERTDSGPVIVSTIGTHPALRNPNREPLDAPAAFLAGTTAQGLVRFDSTGQIVPALAQRWIVSDDGLRYTFRLGRAEWADSGKVTATQVVARLKQAIAPASRNRLKPLLGAIDEVVAMTDDVLEITLKGSRPNFLQLLAQPEMAIVRNDRGAGPYVATASPQGALALSLPKPEEADSGNAPSKPVLHLRGERSSLAIVRFRSGLAHLVTGGTAGDLLVVQAAHVPVSALRFDPVSGLFGLAFARNDGALADSEVRKALSMAIDRAAIISDLDVPGLLPRATLIPPGTDEVPQPAAPLWTGQPIGLRRQQAARTIAASGGAPIRLRVALPPGPGYQVLFAHLRSDWRLIGVEAEAVGPRAPADLRLVDEVAPVTMASWYLRAFTCSASRVCSPDADMAMDVARFATTRGDRRESLVQADMLLNDITPFIPLTAPVRWSLVSPRLTGFQPSMFGLHAAEELIAPSR